MRAAVGEAEAGSPPAQPPEDENRRTAADAVDVSTVLDTIDVERCLSEIYQ